MDDWASDDGGELGELHDLDLPEVELPPEPEPKPQPAPAIPLVNAWTQPRNRGDARSLLRGGPGPAPAPVPGPRGGAPATGNTGRRNFETGYTRRDDRASSSSRGGGQGRGAVLYVSNLPSRVEASEIANMFSDCGVAEIRLTHHSDTGNVKAAFVTLGVGVDPARALSVDGRHLGGRAMHVKIDGTDRPRGGARERAPYGSGGFGPNGASGGNYGAPSYGSSFGGRRPVSNGNGPGSAWGGSGYEPAGGNRDRAGRDREPRQQQIDPTIPTGPPAAGRKKLQLKPRTKPVPVLEIDTRAIGDTHKPRTGGASAFNRGGSRGEGHMFRRGSQGSQGSLDSSKDSELESNKQFTTVKSSSGDQGRTGKDISTLSSRMASAKIGNKSDGTPKPTLKNTFALLGEDEE